MKKILHLMIILVAVVTTSLRAQDTLRFSPHYLVRDVDTVVQGSTHVDSVYLKHLGVGTFTGSISIMTAVLDSSSILHVQDTVAYAVTMGVGVTEGFLLTHKYYTANTAPTGFYRIGNNVIVIWPIAYSHPNTYTHDTIRDTVYVTYATGIHELDVNNLFKLYPNPTRESVTIDAEGPAGKEIEEVTLYDFEGKTIASYKKQRLIDLSAFSKGAYLVKVTFRDGTIGRRKLLIQ
jgi:hypothetical protein